MNKFTNIVIPTYFPFIQMPTIETLSWIIKIWMNYLFNDSNCNTVKMICPIFFYKEWQIMLGQHLVLVSLHQGLQLVLSTTIRVGDTNYHI